MSPKLIKFALEMQNSAVKEETKQTTFFELDYKVFFKQVATEKVRIDN